MWLINEKGEKIFIAGKRNWVGAASEAEQCPVFQSDVEEELIAEEAISCYNCRFRRWTKDAFVCCGSKK